MVKFRTLMVRDEFLRIQEDPEKIVQAVACRGGLLEMLLSDLTFFIGRLPESKSARPCRLCEPKLLRSIRLGVR